MPRLAHNPRVSGASYTSALHPVGARGEMVPVVWTVNGSICQHLRVDAGRLEHIQYALDLRG